MIWLRSALFNAVLYVSGVWFCLAVLARRRGGRDISFAMGQAWARLAVRALRVICRIEIDVNGLENLPVGGGLIAAQHQSTLDILLWLTLLPRPIYVLKRELHELPLFGPALRRAGMIAVDRAGGAAALRQMVAECSTAVAEGRQIVIFPEGTRMAPGVRGILQPGVVAIAKSVGVGMVAAGTDSGFVWARGAFLVRPGRVRVRIAPAITGAGTREEILARIRDCFYGGGA